MSFSKTYCPLKFRQCLGMSCHDIVGVAAKTLYIGVIFAWVYGLSEFWNSFLFLPLEKPKYVYPATYVSKYHPGLSKIWPSPR